MLSLADAKTHVRSLVRDDGGVLDDDSQIEPIITEVASWYRKQFRPILDRVTATSGGLTLTAGQRTLVCSQQNWDRILSIHREPTASSSIDGTPLDPVTLNEWLYLRRKSTAQGTPQCWTAYREATPTSADQGKWRLFFWPDADGTYFFSAMVDKPWVSLTVDTNYFSQLTVAETYTVLRIAAVQLASMMARDDQFIEALQRMLPEYVRLAMGLSERSLVPRSMSGAA